MVTMPLQLVDNQPKKVRKSNPIQDRIILFAQKWEERYPEETYIIAWGMDGKWMKELESVPLDSLSQRLDVYMNKNDDWIVGCRHSLPAFVKNINKFIPETKPAKKKQNPVVLLCECGSPVEFGKDCPNNDCPTNDWKRVSDGRKECMDNMNKFLDQ